MIYEVYLDDKLLYYPGEEEFVILDAVIEQALNDSGSFEFEVPKTNPLYDEIYPRKSMVKVLKNKKEIFCGEVREAEETLDFTKNVYVVGELAFLFDSIQPQARFQNCTPIQFFTTLINRHNSQVEAKKQFAVGVVTVMDPNDSIYRYTNYEDTLTALREKICESLSGYLRIRKVNGVRYLDLLKLEDYGKTCEQPIEFGSNLMDYAANASGNSIATAVLPLGAQLETSVVEGLDAYTTIAEVNDGVDYVYSEEAVEQFGWVKAVVKWNNVTVPANLKRKAEEWLKSNQFESLTLELNALDLSMLDSSIDSFDLGDSVNAKAKPFGMDTWFPVQKKSTYLQEPTKNYITLSNTLKKSYSQQMADKTNQIVAELPQEKSLLQQAKENSSNLIKLADEGYVKVVRGENGKAKELLVMDTEDISTAKRIWRWNINGLGYSSTGYDGEFGLAMTIDGQIVANFIATGTMYADRIRGGALVMGGNGNENGAFYVKDEKGNIIITFDSGGIKMASGTFISWENIDVPDDIATTGQITQITKNTVTTEYVNALGVTAKSVSAENISGSVISGKQIEANYEQADSGYPASGFRVQTDGTAKIYYVSAHAVSVEADLHANGDITSDSNILANNGNVIGYYVGAGKGGIATTGVKARIPDTKNYGTKTLYCYETTSPFFGDVGEGKTDENGQCMIFIDDVLAETINTDTCEYQVFLSPYGQGTLYVSERTAAYFMVIGEPDMAFAWEFKARQLGYEYERLETHEVPEQLEDILDTALSEMELEQTDTLNPALDLMQAEQEELTDD